MTHGCQDEETRERIVGDEKSEASTRIGICWNMHRLRHCQRRGGASVGRCWRLVNQEMKDPTKAAACVAIKNKIK
jgi:hypothetical protein